MWTEGLHENEIIMDTATFIVMALPPGGFVERVLVGGRDHQLRSCLHAAYEDEWVDGFTRFIRARTCGLFHGTNLSDWKGLYGENDEFTMMMLKIGGFDVFWRTIFDDGMRGPHPHLLNWFGGKIGG